MADEATTDTPDPDITPDTPAPAQQEADTQPEVDYRKRYEDLQPEYTRATQTLADREKLLAHIEEKFPELFEDDAPVEEADVVEEPDRANDPRIEELVQWRQQQDQLRYEQDLEKALAGRELDEKGVAYLAYQFQEHGFNPDTVKNAVDGWFEYRDSLAAPAQPKPTPPHVPTGGQAPDGPDTPPAEMTASQYAKWAADQLRAEAA